MTCKAREIMSKKEFQDLVPDEFHQEPDIVNMLSSMFYMQSSFGDHCFGKQGITDNQGDLLTFAKIYDEYQQQKFGANDLTTFWVEKFIECMEKEIEEIRELIPWKHWSKAAIGEEKFPDLPAQERVEMLKIELIDIWHFLMSAMMCLGIGPKELYDQYMSKNKVNFERQQKGYNTARKTEEDNLTLAQNQAGS